MSLFVRIGEAGRVEWPILTTLDFASERSNQGNYLPYIVHPKEIDPWLVELVVFVRAL